MNPNALIAAMAMMNVDEPGFQSIEQLIADGDFTYASLLGTVKSVPYIPKYLGQAEIFNYTSESTNAVKVEFDAQNVILIQSSAPGSPGTTVQLNPRTMKTLTPPRIARTFTVEAAEINRYRQIGSARLENVEERATRKLQQAVRSIFATWEWHRLGATMGKVLDADNSVVEDFYAMMSISQPTLDMTWGTTDAGHVQGKVQGLLNQVEDGLGGLEPDGLPPVVLCGRTFWTAFTTHPNVTAAFQYFESKKQEQSNNPNNPLRDDLRYADFEFCGVRWRQYRGSSTQSGSLVQFMPAAEAHLVVRGVAGTYLGVWCPPEDIVGKTNEPGEPLEMTVEPLPHNAGYEFRIQSNTLHINTRPQVAIKLFSST